MPTVDWRRCRIRICDSKVMTDVETQEQSIQPSRARGGVEPEKYTAEHPEKYAEEHPADCAEEYPQYPEEHANEALLTTWEFDENRIGQRKANRSKVVDESLPDEVRCIDWWLYVEPLGKYTCALQPRLSVWRLYDVRKK